MFGIRGIYFSVLQDFCHTNSCDLPIPQFSSSYKTNSFSIQDWGQYCQANAILGVHGAVLTEFGTSLCFDSIIN